MKASLRRAGRPRRCCPRGGFASQRARPLRRRADRARPHGEARARLHHFTGGGLAFDPGGWPEGFSLFIGKACVRSLAYSLHDAFKADSIRVGTVTIAGFIKGGTPLAPESIAEAYLKMIEGEPDPGPEMVFKGV